MSVSGNGTYTTPNGYTTPTTGTVIGTYQWVASYSGDENNNAATSEQGSEPVPVNSASPTIVTFANPATGSVGGQELRASADPFGGLLSERHDHLHALCLGPRDGGLLRAGRAPAAMAPSPPRTAGSRPRPGPTTGRRATAGTPTIPPSRAAPAHAPAIVSAWTAYISTVIANTQHVPVVSPYHLAPARAASDKEAGATVIDTATVTGEAGESVPTGTVSYTFTGQTARASPVSPSRPAGAFQRTD